MERRSCDPHDHPHRLALVRGLHTVTYIVMATFVLVHAGLTGAAVVALDYGGPPRRRTVVFAGNGTTGPSQFLRSATGPRRATPYDTFLPERATRHTFRFFGTLMVVGLVLLAFRWLRVIGA